MNAAIGVVIAGVVDIFQKCCEIYRGPVTAQGLSPSSVAIRPENLPQGVRDFAGRIPEKEPDADKPIDKQGLKTPSFAQLLNLYRECALENLRHNGYPAERSRQGVINGFKAVLTRLKIKEDEPITVLTRKRIRELEDIGIKEKVSRATIVAWRGHINSITARWARLMYEDRGWYVPKYEIQPFNMQQKKYKALDKETVEKIDAWVERLKEKAPQSAYDRYRFIFVWIMRNLAVRNGDVFRFTWGNFTEINTEKGVKIRSAYVPNKTSKSSQRSATWTMPKEKWMDIGVYAKEPEDKCVRISESDQDEFQRELNKEIKELLPEGRNKGLYELRKLSAHEAYLLGGPKAAVQKTGDSFDTLDTNYVDTSDDVMGE